MTAAGNLFGPNYDTEDIPGLVAALGIEPAHRVLEVGGAGNPFPRANVVCDLTFSSCAQRNGAPGVFRDDVEYIEAPAEALPFDDDAFDFVYCTQVLEHVQDPEAACRELCRVARRGFVEVPSRLGELLNGNPTHRWIVDRVGQILVFHPRPFVEHPLRNCFYGLLFRDQELRALTERRYRNLFNHQVLFEGRLACRIADEEEEVFDYDDNDQAARAHYSFAVNALAGGAEPTYAWPDALEAARRAPDNVHASTLLAIYQARLQKPDDALATLEGLDGAMVEELRAAIEAQRDGRYVDPESLPLPPANLDEDSVARADAARPLVSVVVAGAVPDLLLQSAETALTQDYPDVEVVVSAAVDAVELDAAFGRHHMGDRLRLLAHGGASLGACLNRGAAATGGELVGFLLEGDRYLPHHVDRLVARLGTTAGGAVHSDRILIQGGVLGPDVVPGRPESAGASVSTLLATREALERTGFFDEDGGGRTPATRFLMRLADAEVLEHLREATVLSRDALPEGSDAVAEARVAMRLDPLELMRTLMGAHVREEGLRARVAELEQEISRLQASP